MYEHCPGSTSKPGQQIKRQRKGYRTKYRCEECSIVRGEDVWLCNNTKAIGGGIYKQHLCHMKYHKKNQHLICAAAALSTTAEDSTSTVTPESSPAASPAGESML